jgi:hypothetical protein
MVGRCVWPAESGVSCIAWTVKVTKIDYECNETTKLLRYKDEVVDAIQEIIL